MSGVPITRQGIVRALAAFVRDARDFVVDYPLLPVGLVVLAIIVFGVTRPRVHR